jgi:hypothetical protein
VYPLVNIYGPAESYREVRKVHLILKVIQVIMWVIRASSKTKKGKQCLAENHKPPFLVQLVLVIFPR